METYIRDRFLSYEGPELENIIAALDTVDRDAIAADLAAEAAALPQLTYEEWRAGVDRDAQLARTLRCFIGVLHVAPIVEAYRLLAGPP